MPDSELNWREMIRIRCLGSTFTMNSPMNNPILSKAKEQLWNSKTVIVVSLLILASCLLFKIHRTPHDDGSADGVSFNQNQPQQEANFQVDDLEDVDMDNNSDLEEVDVEPTDAVKTEIQRPGRLSVLFVLADDMRSPLPQLRDQQFSSNVQRTPNIDRLSRRSLVLTKAYSQYSLCGPSRASMLTSRRPDITKIYRNYVNWRESGEFISIPQYFKEHGYLTFGTGKIFHEDITHSVQDTNTWTEYHVVEPAVDEADINWMAVDDKYILDDEQRVRYAKRRLVELAARARTGQDPFFMAVGFRRPSSPYVCPERYYAGFPLEQGNFLPNASWQTPALSTFTKIIGGEDETRISEKTLKELRRGYFACVSYIDALIGDLIDTLKQFDLDESTVVVVTANNGFHLGDNDFYGSYTNHEVAVHVPLVFRVPGKTDAGITTDSLAELVDVFPTVIDAAGLEPIEPCPVRSTEIKKCIDGRSLMPLAKYKHHVIKDAAFSQLARGQDIMEVSVRTDRFRYVDFVEYVKPPSYRKDKFTYLINWNITIHQIPTHRKLYDLNNDPYEQHNLIDDPDYKTDVVFLKEKLVDKFRSVYDYPERIYNMYPHRNH